MKRSVTQRQDCSALYILRRAIALGYGLRDRSLLSMVTDGLSVGEKAWLAADFVTDVTDGLLVGDSIEDVAFFDRLFRQAIVIPSLGEFEGLLTSEEN